MHTNIETFRLISPQTNENKVCANYLRDFEKKQENGSTKKCFEPKKSNTTPAIFDRKLNLQNQWVRVNSIVLNIVVGKKHDNLRLFCSYVATL